MRKKAEAILTSFGKSNSDLVYIGSDLGPSTMKDFKAASPTRFFMEGVSEQYIIDMAVGLSVGGFFPVVQTICTFLTRRCYEQILLGLNLHDDVSFGLIGNGAGFVYAPLGPTHLPLDDISLMLNVENLSIISPSGPEELGALLALHLESRSSFYLRMGKGNEGDVFDGFANFGTGLFGRLENLGSTKLTITTGVVGHYLGLFEDEKINFLQVSLINEQNEAKIAQILTQYDQLVVVEESIKYSGLWRYITTICSKYSINTVPSSIGAETIAPMGYGTQKDHISAFQF
jgi:transketolase